MQQTAVARALEPQQVPAPPEAPPLRPGPQLVREPVGKAVRAPEHAPGTVQGSLFGPMPVSKTEPKRHERSSSSGRRRGQEIEQQAFDFDSTQDGSHTLATTVEAAVYCNAPVALAAHRSIAALIDLAIPVVGLGITLTTIHVAGDYPILASWALPFYAVSLLLLAFLYRLVCCLGNADTIGTQWSGLRLLSFDGRRPTREQRLKRLYGGVISTAAVGIGLLWALADEEHLTWHDHMSKTFPTPHFER